MEQFIQFAHLLADASGRIILPYFESQLEVETKDDKSPVTKADREAEAAIRGLIEQTYPDHAIFGEEGGRKKTISEYTWVIDPIDGTRAFIAGRKEWGTLIALCEDGVPILGILNQPATGERWLGVRGQQTQLNGTPITSRTCDGLAAAEFSTTSVPYFTTEQAGRVVALAKECRHTVKDGDCYAYGLVARSERDLVVDAGLKPYDILALVPILAGAGATITDWAGEPVSMTSYANVVAAGSTALHKQALDILQN